jgi:hypothetical protein
LVREVIKEKVESLGFPVAFIDFQKGDKEGVLRLELENSAKEVLFVLRCYPVYHLEIMP